MRQCGKSVAMLYGQTRPCKLSATTTLTDGTPACWKHAMQEQHRQRIEGVRIEPAKAWWSTCEICEESELHVGVDAQKDAREWAIQHKAEAHP